MLGRRGSCLFFARFWLLLFCCTVSSSALAETIPSTQTQVGTPVSGYWFEGGVFPNPHEACFSKWPYHGNWGGVPGWYSQQAEQVQYWDASTSSWVVTGYTCLLFYKCNCSDNGIQKHEGSISLYGSYCTVGEKVGNTCVSYTCPTTGGWILSPDQQTCSRCPDPAAPILTPEGACVGPQDKGTDCESFSDSADPAATFL